MDDVDPAAVVRAAVRWLFVGVPRGRSALSRPVPSMFVVWTSVWQGAIAALVLGLLLFGASDALPARMAAASLGVFGALVLAGGFVVAAAVDMTVPPPIRRAVAADAAILPAGVRAIGPGAVLVERPEGAVLAVGGPADAGAVAAVTARGDVRWVVGLGGADVDPAWSAAAPGAWVGPATGAPWSGDDLRVEALGERGDVVLCHRPSGSVIVGELFTPAAGDHGRPAGRVARLLATDRLAPPFGWKLAVRDRLALAEAADRVLAGGVDRLVPLRGAPVHDGAREAWADAFAFVR